MRSLRLMVGAVAVGSACALSAVVAFPVSGATPDSLIAFASILACNDDGGWCDSAIYVARSDGTGVRRLTKIDNGIEDPTWSPGRARIAYSDSPYGIWVMRADGSGKRQLCDETGLRIPMHCVEGSAWSPDGSSIAHSSGDAIGVMNSNGGGHRLLIRFSGEPKHLDWSPEGKKIAFDGYEGDYVTGWQGVWLVNTDGRGLKRFVRDAHYPRWSPDGTKLLVIGGPPGGLKNNIYAVDRRGGKRTLVVEQTGILSASWSPDGTRIAYSSSADGQAGLHVFDLKTRRDKRLTLRPSPCAGLKGCSSDYIEGVDWQSRAK